MGALCWLLAALFAPTEACWSGAGRAPPGGAPNGTCCAVLLPTGHRPHGAGQVGAGRTPGREPALHVEEAGRSIAVLSYQAPFLCAALGAPHAAHRDAADNSGLDDLLAADAAYEDEDDEEGEEGEQDEEEEEEEDEEEQEEQEEEPACDEAGEHAGR